MISVNYRVYMETGSRTKSISSIFTKINVEPETNHKFIDQKNDVRKNGKFTSQNEIKENVKFTIQRSEIPRILNTGKGSEFNFQSDKKPEPEQIKTLSTSDHGSLQAKIICVQKQIILRGTEDISPELHENDIMMMQNFQKKYQELSEPWDKLMKSMIQKVESFEKRYQPNDYFDIRDILLGHLVNISLSYILIGPDTKTGYGIDNYRNSLQIKSKPKNLTINEKIVNFIDILPSELKSIHRNSGKLIELHGRRDNNAGKIKNVKESILKLEQLINSQEQDLKKNKVSMQNEKTRNMMNKSIQDNQTIINSKNKEIQTLKEKEQEFNLNEEKIHGMIKKNLECLSIVLDFDYFMHNEYCPVLDHGLI